VYIGDGYCENGDPEFGDYDLSCYGNDGGDCDTVCDNDPTTGTKVLDCDGSGECIPVDWIGDGVCDDDTQPYDADLSCYEQEMTSDCVATTE
jgi:hypothetical protein